MIWIVFSIIIILHLSIDYYQIEILRKSPPHLLETSIALGIVLLTAFLSHGFSLYLIKWPSLYIGVNGIFDLILNFLRKEPLLYEGTVQKDPSKSSILDRFYKFFPPYMPIIFKIVVLLLSIYINLKLT